MIPLALGLVVLAAVCVCYDRENRQLRQERDNLKVRAFNAHQQLRAADEELLRLSDRVACYESWYADENRPG